MKICRCDTEARMNLIAARMGAVFVPAQAIEARRAGTPKSDPVHESAVASPCAQGPSA